MKPGQLALVVWLLVLAGGITAPFAIYRARVAQLEVFGAAPEFVLTDSRERRFSSADLRNEIWVAHFFFSSCPSVCPTVNGRLAGLYRSFGDRVHFVSITVDPANDTPPVLAELATRFGANPDRWHFLTGGGEHIRRLITEGFRLVAEEDPNLHTTRLVLVDRDGHIRGTYQGTEDESTRTLARDLNVLLNG